MDLDHENFDMLEDVDMDIVDDSQLDDSQLILDLNESNTNDEETLHNKDSQRKLLNESTTPNPENEDEEDDEEDEEEEEEEDEDEGYAERSTVASGVDGTDDLIDGEGGMYETLSSSGRGRNHKKERTNAKAVECLDLDGNLIEVFRSGLAASTKLNIPQGDISLCCRGLKRSVSGYRFRFRGDIEDRTEFKLRRGYGYVLEPVLPATSSKENSQSLTATNTLTSTASGGPTTTTATRTTRASRGEYSILNAQQNAERVSNSSRDTFRAIALIKGRSWKQNLVDVGPFTIKKWIPDQPAPTAALQEIKPKLADQKKSKVRVSTRKSTGTSIRTRNNNNNNSYGDNFDE